MGRGVKLSGPKRERRYREWQRIYPFYARYPEPTLRVKNTHIKKYLVWKKYLWDPAGNLSELLYAYLGHLVLHDELAESSARNYLTSAINYEEHYISLGTLVAFNEELFWRNFTSAYGQDSCEGAHIWTLDEIESKWKRLSVRETGIAKLGFTSGMRGISIASVDGLKCKPKKIEALVNHAKGYARTALPVAKMACICVMKGGVKVGTSPLCFVCDSHARKTVKSYTLAEVVETAKKLGGTTHSFRRTVATSVVLRTLKRLQVPLKKLTTTHYAIINKMFLWSPKSRTLKRYVKDHEFYIGQKMPYCGGVIGTLD